MYCIPNWVILLSLIICTPIWHKSITIPVAVTILLWFFNTFATGVSLFLACSFLFSFGNYCELSVFLDVFLYGSSILLNHELEPVKTIRRFENFLQASIFLSRLMPSWNQCYYTFISHAMLVPPLCLLCSKCRNITTTSNKCIWCSYLHMLQPYKIILVELNW